MPEGRVGLPVSVAAGAAAWLVAFYAGVVWASRIGNPVGLIVPYFAASLLGPFLTLVLARGHAKSAQHLVAFAPILLGSILAAPIILAGVAPTVAGGVPDRLRTTLVLFELLFLPIGLALAMLSRWGARRGHVAEQ
ncbi:MAG: hypothetical protein HYT80_03725 [Euryarchaeota archaeon]|nr:hypothetical protein [Euryarchaeota archaeon]